MEFDVSKRRGNQEEKSTAFVAPMNPQYTRSLQNFLTMLETIDHFELV